MSAVLLLMGAGWGLCIPLTIVAVSTGYQPIGLIFWQVTIVAVLMTGLTWARGRRIPFGRTSFTTFLVVALLGALLPDTIYYAVAPYLDGGVLSIIMASVPMFAFPIALVLGNDRFAPVRLIGLGCGMFGILFLLFPDTSLTGLTALAVVPLALLAPLSYASEVNYVSKFGTAGMDPIQVLAGASILAMCISFPAALLSGQWINPLPPYGLADMALVASSAVHAAVYATYVWLTRRAGSVFASQTAYFVTGFGILWSILLLQETYSGTVWAALALMFIGLFLVQPRGSAQIETDAPARG
ncbi:MAG: DMT family transporter [Pseudomonadota bacterium]